MLERIKQIASFIAFYIVFTVVTLSQNMIYGNIDTPNIPFILNNKILEVKNSMLI